MRLRNRRPTFPNPSLCPRRLRPRPASDYTPKLNDPFLVEETSRRMGWSCYPLKKTESTILKDDSRKRLQLESHKDGRKVFEDDESDDMTPMEETSNDTSVGHAGVQDNGVGGLDTTTNNQQCKDPPIDAVNFAQILRAVFSQEGYEHRHAEKEYTSERKVSTKAIKEEPVEAVTEVDGRKYPNQHDAKEGNGNQNKKDRCCLENVENFLSPEHSDFELNDLLDMDSDMSSSQLSNQLTGDRRRKRNKTDDEDWAVEYFRKKAPKRGKPKKAKDDAMKDESRCPEKKPQKKRGRPKKVEKRKVGRPRKAICTPSNVENLKKEVVVERPRRGRKKAGETSSNPILIK